MKNHHWYPLYNVYAILERASDPRQDIGLNIGLQKQPELDGRNGKDSI